MGRTIKTIFAKLSRNRATPLSALVTKTTRFVRESVSAALFLRTCDRVGSHPRVDGVLRVHNEGHIVLGDDVRLISKWAPIELSTRRGATITIGSGSSINYGTLVSASKGVTIGNRVMIGNYCVIADTQVPGIARDERDADIDESAALPIEIGDGAWLAVRVTVLPGSRIGAGAVVTAGSVVDGDIPPGVIAGGVPARVLRSSVVPSAPVSKPAAPLSHEAATRSEAMAEVAP